MHCLGLFFTNVDVEHLFQKVANLHDLRSNVTDFTWLCSEHVAKFQREVRGKVNSVINTDNSLLCATVWHIRENCRYFCSHSAVKVQQPMLGEVHGGVRLPQRPMCRGRNYSRKYLHHPLQVIADG